MSADIQEGTRIYYTGDMANVEGFGSVIARDPSGQVRILLDDGRDFWIYAQGIGHEYHGHCNPRFVTAEAVAEFRKIRMAAVHEAAARYRTA